MLPQLRKQIKHIKDGMPLWTDEVRRYELSLETHSIKVLSQMSRLELLQQKDKILSELKKLEELC